MPSILTLDGVSTRPRRSGKPLGEDKTGCRCAFNPKTKRGTKLCPVPKSAKHRNGLKIVGRC